MAKTRGGMLFRVLCFFMIFLWFLTILLPITWCFTDFVLVEVVNWSSALICVYWSCITCSDFVLNEIVFIKLWFVFIDIVICVYSSCDLCLFRLWIDVVLWFFISRFFPVIIVIWCALVKFLSCYWYITKNHYWFC